jgi:hypothetical protein
MGYIFSAAFMANMLSMTAMLILLSLTGKSHMAADLGIVQASTSALFYAFSSNARNIVLATSTSALAKSIFNLRLILLAPLVLVALWLNSKLGGVESTFAAILILRRAVEWFGEVDLSERERLGDERFALMYLLVQMILFGIAGLWMLLNMPHPLWGLFCWALLPLLLSAKFARVAIEDFANVLSSVNKKIAPHLGSTLITGVSLYVFRLLMILLLGKSIAGDLFAAFAIGGILGSLTLNAFGPSIAFAEKIDGTFKFPKLLTSILWIFAVVGLLIVGLSFGRPDVFAASHKHIIFWEAIGFSMIGGVVMTHAQLLRNRLLIHNEHHDLFGPDLLMNMLIIAITPLAYFTLGLDAMAGLSLVGAMLALVFYKSSEIVEIIEKGQHPLAIKYFQFLIAILILMPVFLQINSGIFLAKETLTSATSVMSLPLPISIFITYLAILIIGLYRSVHLSLSVIFFSFILMFLSAILVAAGQGELARAKVILIIQYTLPMGALVLGEMFKATWFGDEARIEQGFLFVLAVIVPLQLAASLMQGSSQLASYIYIFSIYQHVQYVPIIFASAYLWVIFALWQDLRYRNVLLILSPVMGVYAAASLSLVAIMLLVTGVLTFAILRWRLVAEKLPASLFVVLLLSCLGYLSVEVSTISLIFKFKDVAFETISSWRLYIVSIVDSVESLLWGHVDILDKSHFPSAHNYYLDMVRNFGLIAALPIFGLLGYTVRGAYLARRYLIANSSLLGLLLVLLFLLVIDNSTQVSLRQPYSGVFIFFLWGVFIARLGKIKVAS